MREASCWHREISIASPQNFDVSLPMAAGSTKSLKVLRCTKHASMRRLRCRLCG